MINHKYIGNHISYPAYRNSICPVDYMVDVSNKAIELCHCGSHINVSPPVAYICF